MVEIKIDPVTRIEGHLGITVNVEGEVVTDAKCHANTFRGFEKIVVGRDPRDAPTLLQRICGVCHNDHRLASLRAIEDAAGVQIPLMATLVRDAIAAVGFLYSHAAHLYVLAGVDFSNAERGTGLDRFDFLTGGGYQEAIYYQRKLHEALCVLGAKAPHHMTTVPGGVSYELNVNQVTQVATIAKEVSDWVGQTKNIPAVIENVSAGKVDPSMGMALHDLVSLLLKAAESGAADWGVSHGRFLAMGVFDLPDGSQFLPAGYYDGSSVKPFDEKKVTEQVKHSWYTDASGGMYVGDAPSLEPQYGKEGAYTWAKAPTYDGKAVETGPLARLVAAQLDPFDLRKALGGDPNKSSVLNRLIARAQEIVVIRDATVAWLLGYDTAASLLGLNDMPASYQQLIGKGLPDGKGALQLIKEGATKSYTDYKNPSSGFGVGLWEAPRGALAHWVNIEGGKIQRYQVIAPTTWNVRPRDDNGELGPIEKALIGVPEPDTSDPINTVRTIRSYDVCLACTVHAMTPEGKKYTVDLNPGC